MKEILCFCVAAGVENVANSNSIIFYIKDKRLYVTEVTLTAKDTKKLSKFIKKGLKVLCTRMKVKKVRI